MPKNQRDLPGSVRGMSRKQFLNRLSQHSTRRHGEPVTDRMLRSWCEEGFVSEPQRKGLGRGRGSASLWCPQQYRQACKVCRFRSQGAKSEDSLRIMCWLSGHYVTVKRLRASCLRELRRIRSSRRMSPRSLVDPNQEDLTPRTIKGLAKSAGQLDPRLVPSFNYSDTEKVEMLALLKGGVMKTSHAKSLVNATMPRLTGQIDMQQLPSLFLGVLGSSEEIENSGEELLQSAELEDFKKARKLLREIIMVIKALPKLLENPQLKAQNIVDPQLFIMPLKALGQPNYKILFFLTLISAVQRNAIPPEMELCTQLLEQFSRCQSK